MHLIQRKRPPPDCDSPSLQVSPYLSVPICVSTNLEDYPRILWRYGRSMAALSYSVGLESSLPCSKSDLRTCLWAAIGMARDAEARTKLCSGYVRLEAFVTDAEFKAVRDMEDLHRGATRVRHDDSVQPLPMWAARPETHRDATAVLARVAERMLLRRRELEGLC